MWFTDNELEQFRLNFSRCANREVAPLKLAMFNHYQAMESGTFKV